MVVCLKICSISLVSPAEQLIAVLVVVNEDTGIISSSVTVAVYALKVKGSADVLPFLCCTQGLVRFSCKVFRLHSSTQKAISIHNMSQWI